MRILVIEDEYNLADAITSTLKAEGYKSEFALDGQTGLDLALSNQFDLVVLDVMLPKLNGIEILKEIRDSGLDIKVIMLTAKSTIEDKMTGFNNGANDYLTKPFHMDELLARVNLQLMNNANKNNVISFGDLKYDVKELTMSNADTGSSVEVIGKECEIIEMLMQNSNQVLEKEQIFVKVWGYDSDSDINSLEVYVSFLRKKIKLIKCHVTIKTIRGIGYKLEEEK